MNDEGTNMTVPRGPWCGVMRDAHLLRNVSSVDRGKAVRHDLGIRTVACNGRFVGWVKGKDEG